MVLSWREGLKFYISLFLFFVVIFYLRSQINNVFVISGLIALIGLFFILFLREKQEIIDLKDKGLMRYTLLCHNCNWEWMSNVTDKKYSNKCPNCSEDSKIEVIGIRKVSKIVKKSNKDLTSYFGR